MNQNAQNVTDNDMHWKKNFELECTKGYLAQSTVTVENTDYFSAEE